MIVSTVLNLIFVPVLYVTFAAMRKRATLQVAYSGSHAAPGNGAKVHSESGAAANFISGGEVD